MSETIRGPETPFVVNVDPTDDGRWRATLTNFPWPDGTPGEVSVVAAGAVEARHMMSIAYGNAFKDAAKRAGWATYPIVRSEQF